MDSTANLNLFSCCLFWRKYEHYAQLYGSWLFVNQNVIDMFSLVNIAKNFITFYSCRNCFSASLDTHMPYPDSLNASMALQASTPRAVSEEDISR